MLSLRTASPSPDRGGRQIHHSNSSPPKVLSQDPTNYVRLRVDQPSASHFHQGLDQDSRAPENNEALSTQEASHPTCSIEQGSSTRVTRSPNRCRVESYHPVSTQDPRQPLVEVLSTAPKTRSGRSRRSSELSQYHQSMGNNASAMIRRSRSKIFREQGDSPETTVCALISPPLLQRCDFSVYASCVHLALEISTASKPLYKPKKTDRMISDRSLTRPLHLLKYLHVQAQSHRFGLVAQSQALPTSGKTRRLQR